MIAAIEAGALCGQAEERFGFGKASAIRWHARFRAEGEFAAKPSAGATNGQRFVSYVTDTLMPALHPGDMVVMDNLAAHKVAG